MPSTEYIPTYALALEGFYLLYEVLIDLQAHDPRKKVVHRKIDCFSKKCMEEFNLELSKGVN